MHLSRNGALVLLTALASAAFFHLAALAAGSAGTTAVAAHPAGMAALPLAFEPNRGQVGAPVDFLAHGPGYRIFLTASEAVLALTPSPAGERVVRVYFAGAGAASAAEPSAPLPGTVNYYLGNDPEAWKVGVPTFARVRYRDVYPGVDLEYYGARQQLEYDFRVAPGADPAVIVLSFESAGPLSLDAEGNLTICLGDGVLVQRAPAVYQDVDGIRHPVAGRFALRGGTLVGFEIGEYDLAAPLIIDPVVLSYSTYLGGTAGDGARDVAVDGAGNVYLTGWAWSRDFPAVAALQPAKPDPENVYCGVVPYPPPHCYSNCPFDPCQDSFVAKLAADGQTLIYSTYLGGTGDDRATALAVDGGGNVYVTGKSDSGDFPTLNPFPDLSAGDVFVTKLDPAGALASSTHWGTGSYSIGSDIVVDAGGKVYIAGTTSGWSLPAAPSGFWRSRNTSSGGMCEVGGPWVHECTVGFVARLDLAGPTTEYATFVGRPGMDDHASALAVDAAGNAYVATSTSGLLSKVNPDGSALVYQIPLRADAVAVDAAGHAYAAGHAGGGLVTTNGAFDRVCGSDGSGTDAFVTKVSPDGATYLYSTYLGGSGGDAARDIAIDGDGHAVVVGVTSSADFPTTPGAIDASCGSDGLCNAAGATSSDDVFVARLGAAGQSLIFSTYLGGASQDSAGGVALAPGGGVWVAGWTQSADFPVATPIQATRLGAEDAFAARITETGCRSEYSTAVPESGRVGAAIAFDATLVATGCTGGATFEWDFGDGSPHALQEDASHAYGAAGSYPWSLTVTFAGQTRSVGGSIRIGCRLTCSASAPAAAQTGAAMAFAAAAALSDCYGAPAFAWEFGDGTPATGEQNPTHAYAQSGVFPWRLTVTADDASCVEQGTVRVFTPPTIFTDDFETDLAAWSVASTGGKAWGHSTHRAFTGTGSAWCAGGGAAPAAPGGNYDANTVTTMTFGPFSLAGTSVARAVFAYWTENHVWDYLAWGVSLDGQVFKWTDVEPSTYDAWLVKQVNLAALANPAVLGQPAVWFALRFTSDGIWQDEGSYVDDVRIEALAPQCLVSCSATVPAAAQAQVPVSFVGSAATDACNPSWPSYLWDFGDGATSTQTSPSHTYAAAGTYAWSLTATTAGVSCVRSGTITVSPPPPCSVTCDAVVPATGFAGFASAFQGTGAASFCGGGPVGFAWSFGDGSPVSTEEDPSHIFGVPGTYPWQMTATAGTGSCTRSGEIAVTAPPPCSLACGATVPPGAGTGAAVPFAGSATPTLCHGVPTIRWAFGDGAPLAAGGATSHAYGAPGAYAWTMLAEADGARCVQSGTVAVSAQQVEVVLADGFEGDFPGPWAVTPAVATHWGPSTHRTASGAKSAYCAGGGTPAAPAGGPYFAGMDTAMVFGPFSLAGATAARATFKYWLDTEQGWDWFTWAVSVNGTSFFGSRTSGTATGWQTRELDLASIGAITPLGSPQVWLAFFFDSDSVIQKEGVYVDDVRIERTLPGGGGCTVTCDATVPPSALAGVAVQLGASAVATACSGPVGFAWDAGDGSPPSAEHNPVHTYASPGLRLWQVTAAAGDGACGRSGVIDVAMPPIAPLRRHLRH